MESLGCTSGRRIGTGLSFVLFPLVFIFVFAIHPNLLSFEVITDIRDRIAEFHGNRLMHFGHFLMLLTVPLLIVAALHLDGRLRAARPRTALVGCCLAVFGSVLLAVDKTALCLVPSAFDTLPEGQFDQMLPGLEAMFAFEGWLAVLYLLPMLPLGFLVLGFGLFTSGVIPRWQSGGLMAAMVLLGVAAALDIDLIGLVASVVMAFALVPLGISISRASDSGSVRT